MAYWQRNVSSTTNRFPFIICIDVYIYLFQLLKQERIKDYLLMEEEFIRNQERLKPQEEKIEEERAKVDDLRGTPMSVGR